MRNMSLLATDKCIFIEGKRRFQLTINVRERLLSCLSSGVFVLRPSQVTVIGRHNRGHDCEWWWQRGWWWSWQLIFSGNVPCAGPRAKCFPWIISWNSHHYLMHHYPHFTDAETGVRENTLLHIASLGNEQSQAVSPQSQQLNILFLNLNYF